MSRYFWQKTVSFFLTALLVSIVTFMIIQILPGDPALLILGTEGSPQAYEQLRSELQLHRPAILRYLSWLGGFFQGKWGSSLRYSLPVKELVAEAIPLSLRLALFAVGLALIVAISGGMVMAAHAQSRLAHLLSFGSQIGMAIPQFWLGLLLIQVFAVRLQLLPAGGSDELASLILPVATLALPRAAVLTRFVHVGLREALEQDYIRTARAKGLPSRTVFYKHALRNGALGVFTVAGLQLAQLLAGTIVVEQVFGLPGVGQLLLAGVLQRDLPLVQTLVMLIVILILMFNLLFDLCLGFLDPRLRYE